MTPPFRADHVGSLLRPQELHEARAKAKQGEITQEALKAVQDRCIKEVIVLQESIGIGSVTDGEFRRDWWHIDFLARLRRRGAREGRRLRRCQVQGHRGAAALHAGREPHPPHAAQHARALQVPQGEREEGDAEIHHALAGDAPRTRRPRLDQEDLSQPRRISGPISRSATARRSRDLYKAGCRYLQIDDTTIAMFGDPKVQEQFRKLGDDPKRDVALYAEAVNAAIRDVPDDMAVAIHTCRGNFKSTWLASGSYDYVAETAFSKLSVDGFFLEFDTERAGGFEPLRYIPKGKKVVLGLVSSKVPQLEAKDQLKRRIEQASKFVPLENLCISPQCGFSSTHHGNNLTEDQEKAKLRLCIDTAREVWG